MSLSFERIEGAAETARQLDAFLPAYEEVYAEAPYCEGPRDVAEFIDRYQRQNQRRGFRLVLAYDGGEVMGFTFGFLLPVDTAWWSTMAEPLPEHFTAETGTRSFAVIELAVRKPWRRKGVAAELHRRLTEDLAVERVTLTQRPEPDAAPAQKAYRNWGYRKVGKSRPWDEAPVYDVMVLALS